MFPTSIYQYYYTDYSCQHKTGGSLKESLCTGHALLEAHDSSARVSPEGCALWKAYGILLYGRLLNMRARSGRG